MGQLQKAGKKRQLPSQLQVLLFLLPVSCSVSWISFFSLFLFLQFGCAVQRAQRGKGEGQSVQGCAHQVLAQCRLDTDKKQAHPSLWNMSFSWMPIRIKRRIWILVGSLCLFSLLLLNYKYSLFYFTWLLFGYGKYNLVAFLAFIQSRLFYF